jgi:hypothetical protein
MLFGQSSRVITPYRRWICIDIKAAPGRWKKFNLMSGLSLWSGSVKIQTVLESYRMLCFMQAEDEESFTKKALSYLSVM